MDEKGNEIEVEGRVHSADYWIKEGFKAPSDLQVLRNFQNAIKKIGGKVVKQGKSETYLKLRKAGKTYWVIDGPGSCSGREKPYECYSNHRPCLDLWHLL